MAKMCCRLSTHPQSNHVFLDYQWFKTLGLAVFLLFFHKILAPLKVLNMFWCYNQESEQI